MSGIQLKLASISNNQSLSVPGFTVERAGDLV